MKTNLPLFFLLLPFFAFSQSDCEKLFHQYSPLHSSLKTTTLVINDLVDNCNIGELRRDEIASSRSFMNNDLISATNNGILTHSDETTNFSLQPGENKLLQYKRSKNEVISDANKLLDILEEYGGAISGVIASSSVAKACVSLGTAASSIFTPAGGIALGSACTFIGGVAVSVASPKLTKKVVDLFRPANSEIEDKKVVDNLKDIIADKKARGLLGNCDSDLCFEKDFFDESLDFASNEKDITSSYTSEIDIDNIEPKMLSDQERKIKNEALSNDIKGIKKEIELNQLETMKAVNQLSQDMETMANDLEDFQQETKKNFDTMNKKFDNLVKNDEIVIEELNEHRKLIEQNATDNAIIADIMIGQLGSGQQAKLYDLCLSGKEGCPSVLKNTLGTTAADRDTFMMKRDRLNRITKAQNFIKTTQQISEALDVGYDLAVKLGLKGSDQEKVAKGMSFAKAGLATVSGIARIYGGDVFGGTMALLKGLGGFLGSEDEPMPSPEMQEIMKLQEKMNQRFDVVDAKLDHIISLQIEMHKDLSRNIKANRELMQYRFNNVDYQLAEILDNQVIIQSQLKAILLNKVKNCYTLVNTIQENESIRALSTYKNYEDLYSVNSSQCAKCMEGIRDALNFESTDFSTVDLSPYTINRDNKYVRDEAETFEKMVTFFKWYYGDQLGNLENALQLLLLPTKEVSRNQDIYCELRGEVTNSILNLDKTLNNINYLDPYSFRDLATIYSIFYPFFEIQRDGDFNYQPFSRDEFIKYASDNSGVLDSRKTLISTDVENLINISKTLKAQQALMSGHLLIQPFYYIIHQNQYSSNDRIEYNNLLVTPKQLAIDILAKNPTMAQNYATYVIRKNFRLDEFIYKANFDGTPINPNYNHFINYAYDKTNPRLFFSGVDSFYVNETKLLGVDEKILADNSYIDKLSFLKLTREGNDFAYLQLQEEKCLENDFIVCSATIPVPEKGIVESNSFILTSGYQYAGETDFLLNKLVDEIKFSDGFRDNWMESTQIKLTLLNQNN